MPQLKDALRLKAQLDTLRSAMRDVQVSIGAYYRETARTADPEELATTVRGAVGLSGGDIHDGQNRIILILFRLGKSVSI